jgi:plastocyanin
MKIVKTIPFFVLGLIFIGTSFSDSNAQLVANQPYLVEGSGFAVTDKSIKISQIDFLISTGSQVGSSTKIVVEDGFVTINEIDFVATELTGTMLRDGHFIRLAGTAENTIGSKVSISIFGRLIENSDEGSIYSFSGKLIQGTESNKIIYTTKISTLGGTLPLSSSKTPTSSDQTQASEIIIHISKGASDPASFNYIAQGYIQQKSFYSTNRISTIPGTTLTFINDDTVSHNISSGKRDTSSGGSPNIADGKIASGDILPGKKWSVTLDEIGFISLFDVDYPWMTIDVVVFPDIESGVIKKSASNPPN